MLQARVTWFMSQGKVELKLPSLSLLLQPHRPLCGFLQPRTSNDDADARSTKSYRSAVSMSIMMIRKVWVSMKFVSAKLVLPPTPQKRAQNEVFKTVQISRKSSKLTLFPGGGSNFMDKATSGRF